LGNLSCCENWHGYLLFSNLNVDNLLTDLLNYSSLLILFNSNLNKLLILLNDNCLHNCFLILLFDNWLNFLYFCLWFCHFDFGKNLNNKWSLYIFFFSRCHSLNSGGLINCYFRYVCRWSFWFLGLICQYWSHINNLWHFLVMGLIGFDC